MGSLANISAAIFSSLPHLNWVGFYLDDGHQLRLGPFQGKPACTHIAYNRGVCGAAFSQKKIMVVNDVGNFPDHIVCDAASQAEVVVPLLYNDVVWGVLDIDSPLKERFSVADVELMQQIGQLLSRQLALPPSLWFS